jgi:hypothetical protein
VLDKVKKKFGDAALTRGALLEVKRKARPGRSAKDPRRRDG